MLVNTETLSQHLADPGWIIFDCRHDLFAPARGAALYHESHIPGAHFAAVDTALSGPLSGRNGRHPLPAPAAFADFLARLVKEGLDGKPAAGTPGQRGE